jgi:hypothetical protein
VSRSIIFTDQHAPDGRTIRFNVDLSTPEAAALVEQHFQAGTLIPIPNEDGGDPIFVSPERVATISPQKEDVQ